MFCKFYLDAQEWFCSYVECTSAAIQALISFRKLYPGHRKKEVDECIEKAVKFIESIQAADGSWLVSSHYKSICRITFFPYILSLIF